MIAYSTLLTVLLSIFVSEALASPPSTPAPNTSTVRLDPYEVTNRQMAAFLTEFGNPRIRGMVLVDVGSSQSLITEHGDTFQPKEGFANHPAVAVSFAGAKAYCEWAGKRLPTEPEWHRACTGSEEYTYPWGQIYEADTPVHALPANLKGTTDGFARTAPVGLFPAGRSADGLWDLGGNVWEWTVGPEDKAILRGGSWANSHLYARCSVRDDPSSSHTFFKASSVGFRCATDIE